MKPAILNNRYARLAVVASVIAGVFLFNRGQQNNDVYNIETSQVDVGQFNKTILASGKLGYAQEIILRSELTGRVKSILVQEGERVAQGQPILELDSSTLQANVEQQRANLSIKRLSIERSIVEYQKLREQVENRRQLVDKQLVSEESLDILEQDLSISKINIEIAKKEALLIEYRLNESAENLNKTIIRSPIDGLVVNIPIKIGETAIAGVSNVAGSELVKLVDTNQVYANLYVDENDITHVKEGLATQITVIAEPDKAYRATIERISLLAEPKQANKPLKYKVVAALEEPITHIKSDMTLRAEITYQRFEAQMSIPIQAILYASDMASDIGTIFVLDGDKVAQREVVLGDANEEFQVVNDGLKVGDVYVTGPYKTLKNLYDGARVTTNGI
ncbi:efflux RND transporter periplasmic adaptor subunit [Aestuariibacter halophilus]|uniref:Efflux RND transporter periplasmic adaptor subunit n=1 Tax=Fluctibacter halophilus TaxID=226011 RepID=A0ABS8G8W0_9ALTE|nr:efflux RND transporter periplasmic adaptor subunit [Aestuariibacter halophilus]MCC2616134.1 efflux RND transporter periplasmic adaptor subunit [Aestuariibacter halophilus]